jgi:hypothetical protein
LKTLLILSFACLAACAEDAQVQGPVPVCTTDRTTLPVVLYPDGIFRTSIMKSCGDGCVTYSWVSDSFVTFKVCAGSVQSSEVLYIDSGK